MEYAHHLRMRFPQLHITDDLMPVPPHKQYLATVVSYCQMGGFLMAFFGSQIFSALSMPVPAWAQYLQENKGMSIGIFFFGNIINSNLISVCSPFLLSINVESILTYFRACVRPALSRSILAANYFIPRSRRACFPISINWSG